MFDFIVQIFDVSVNQLGKEIDDLKNQKKLVTEEMTSAKEDGDLKENSGYHMARDQLAIINAKLTEAQKVFTGSKQIVYTDDIDVKDTVVLGCEVELDYNDGTIPKKWLLSDGFYKHDNAISYKSPIGGLIVGRKLGDNFQFREFYITITSVSKYEFPKELVATS